jgi:hypothetical protein
MEIGGFRVTLITNFKEQANFFRPKPPFTMTPFSNSYWKVVPTYWLGVKEEFGTNLKHYFGYSHLLINYEDVLKRGLSLQEYVENGHAQGIDKDRVSEYVKDFKIKGYWMVSQILFDKELLSKAYLENGTCRVCKM